jgi:hypothetical protein
MSAIHTAPLALVGLVFFVLLLWGVEVGYRGHGWLLRLRPPGDNKEKGAQDHLLAAVLGLLALLLGFTFSVALDRYETRRELVVQEANAIGATWLRTQLLDEPNRSAMTGLLRDYAKTRLAWSMVDEFDMAPTNALQAKIWAVTTNVVRTDTTQGVGRMLVDSVNQTFDLASSRKAERTAHIPSRVFEVLLIYAVLSMAMLGYIMRSGRQAHRVATTLVLTLISLALVLILDLDRPRSGGIQVPQEPLEQLMASMKTPAPALTPTPG